MKPVIKYSLASDPSVEIQVLYDDTADSYTLMVSTHAGEIEGRDVLGGITPADGETLAEIVIDLVKQYDMVETAKDDLRSKLEG